MRHSFLAGSVLGQVLLKTHSIGGLDGLLGDEGLVSRGPEFSLTLHIGGIQRQEVLLMKARHAQPQLKEGFARGFELREHACRGSKGHVLHLRGLHGQGGRERLGRITAIEPLVDSNTRNFTAQATFQNPNTALRPGSFAHVSFDLGGERNVVVIPQTAVSFNPYGNAVFVIAKTKRAEGEKDMQGKPLTGDKLIVKQRFVKTGATRGDLIAITDGLKASEQVVTSGLLKLRNDAEVTINNKVQPAADARPETQNR